MKASQKKPSLRGNRLLTGLWSPKAPTTPRPKGPLPDVLFLSSEDADAALLYRSLAARAELRPGALLQTHYFDAHYAHGPAWYEAQFPKRRRRSDQGVVLAEGGADYLFHPQAPERAARLLPTAQLVLTLRHPVARAYRHYRRSVALGEETLPFERAVVLESTRLEAELAQLGPDAFARGKSHRHHSYLARGRYDEQLGRWFAHFPRAHFFVSESERAPAAVCAEVLRFLNLPGTAGARSAPPTEEPPDLSPELAAQLSAYFAPHLSRLSALLGRALWQEAAEPEKVAV